MAMFLWYLFTTGNGDCLYNAISLALVGNELISNDIKLAMVFIFLDYEDYFRKIVESFKYSSSFESKVVDSASLGVYGNEFNMIALSMLFLRPIKCYSLHNIALNVNTSKKFALPIYPSLKNEHFTPIIPLNEYFQIGQTNGFEFIENDLRILEIEGINIFREEKLINIKGSICFVVADNLGANGLGGLVESFSPTNRHQLHQNYCLSSLNLLNDFEIGPQTKNKEDVINRFETVMNLKITNTKKWLKYNGFEYHEGDSIQIKYENNLPKFQELTAFCLWIIV
ncbi:unnamed protein product [Brachionus calyciflorus]|uniref:OTU domain-containing protein n=1 Tax=Brachionus calyciflorus TaxID=104777 RepID=A0A814HPX3_9BILA|nr:unnamed protein product [Brachionus calyciflorus]